MNERAIWDFLYGKTKNPIGTAAVMGNLMAESSLNPICATGKNKTPNYVADADSGAIDFTRDGVAFGLVQWCYYARKGGLLDYAKKTGTSVGDLNTQLEYMWKELQGYKMVLNAVVNATNIRAASDIVMLKYERPATTTEAAKAKRAAYGKSFYDQFWKPKAEEAQTETGKKTVKAKTVVNLRAGRGTGTAKIGELKRGQQLELLETDKGWHKVACWVCGDFVEVSK